MVNIYGVSAATATAWLLGVINDAGLDRSKQEVAYLNELIGRESYPKFLRQVIALNQAGCHACIAHVVNPDMVRRYKRYGGVVTHQEEIIWRGEKRVAVRLAVPPAGFLRFVHRIARFPALSSPSAPHQNAL
jgi:hypothetical protein